MPTPEYILNLRKKIGHDMLFVPATSAVVINEAGEILLQRRKDNGRWALPGGIMEPGEQPAESAARETWEETGITIEPLRVSGVYGGPDMIVNYANGDVSRYISICFVCRPISGTPYANDGEATEVAYFATDALPKNIEPRHVIRIQHALENNPQAWFKPPPV
jgi:8-oxo-dGTP pyrophosphatase MutT (NUDIX family)